jgi:hypothetical protein
MSCNCKSLQPSIPVSPQGLPDVADVYPCAGGTVAESTCPTASVSSAPSLGSSLGTEWTDAAPADGIAEGVVPLMRYGKKNVRFYGSGFLQFFSGRARLVTSIYLKVTNLWHERWTPSRIGAKPLLGNPLPFPFFVIADTEGNLHAIQGQQDATILRDSMNVWSFDRKQWEVRDIADFPALQKGLLPQVSEIEVTGFAAIPMSGSSSDVRQISALAGEGFFRLKKIPTVNASCDCPGCAVVPAFAYVTEFVADPVDPGTYSLKCVIDEEGVKSFAWTED